MSNRCSQVLERASRYALLAVSAIGLRQRDPGAVVNGALSFVGTYLPSIVERRFGVELRPWQRVYVAAAMVNHSVGMLGPYDDVWWWDHLTHTHSATLLGGVVFAVARRRGRDPGPRVVAVVVCAGVLWEVAEYAIHATARRLGVEPVLVTYGRSDTLFDLLFDLVGALLVVVLGDYLLDNLAEPSERPAGSGSRTAG
jgi:xanthosine utilization system XapX-like protein